MELDLVITIPRQTLALHALWLYLSQSKFNDRISSLDAWLLNMDKWTKFVLDQTGNRKWGQV